VVAAEVSRTDVVIARNAAARMRSFSWRAMRTSCWARMVSGESLMSAPRRLDPSAAICLRAREGGRVRSEAEESQTCWQTIRLRGQRGG
jgi:hypothetical protein